jgi:hypothetical protein
VFGPPAALPQAIGKLPAERLEAPEGLLERRTWRSKREELFRESNLLLDQFSSLARTQEGEQELWYLMDVI